MSSTKRCTKSKDFCKDEYLKVTGMVARLDETARILQIVNTKIPFDDILDVVLPDD